MSMGYLGWKHYPGLPSIPKRRILLMMLALEITAIVLLAVETTLYERGLHSLVVVKLLGIAMVIYLTSRFATRLEGLFDLILKTTTHWRIHLIVLLVLFICPGSDRLGLAATKTAFFLGLFMSRLQHDNQGLEEFIAPISRRFLIPIFFFSLGLQVKGSFLFSTARLVAIGAAAVIIGWRLVLHRRLLPTRGDDRAFLLLCPNLTIVALASNTLLQDGTAPLAGSWLLLTGLFGTVPAILLLPKPAPETETSDSHAAAA